MPVVTLIRSRSLSGAEYAYAATVPAGSRLIFLAGACPLNSDGTTAAPGDYAGQAAKALQNMQTALADASASVEDVISTRVLVASSRRQDLVAAARHVLRLPHHRSRRVRHLRVAGQQRDGRVPPHPAAAVRGQHVIL